MLVYFECFNTVQIAHACLRRIFQCESVYLHFTYNDIYICYTKVKWRARDKAVIEHIPKRNIGRLLFRSIELDCWWFLADSNFIYHKAIRQDIQKTRNGTKNFFKYNFGSTDFICFLSLKRITLNGIAGYLPILVFNFNLYGGVCTFRTPHCKGLFVKEIC